MRIFRSPHRVQGFRDTCTSCIFQKIINILFLCFRKGHANYLSQKALEMDPEVWVCCSGLLSCSFWKVTGLDCPGLHCSEGNNTAHPLTPTSPLSLPLTPKSLVDLPFAGSGACPSSLQLIFFFPSVWTGFDPDSSLPRAPSQKIF